VCHVGLKDSEFLDEIVDVRVDGYNREMGDAGLILLGATREEAPLMDAE